MISFEFSMTNLVVMAAIAFLAVFYVLILLKLKPSTEKKDQHKKDVLPEKREQPPPKNGLIFVNSLKTKEKTTPPQRTQNSINPQKIRHPLTETTSPSSPKDRNQETPEHMVISENRSSNLHCVHHFGYLTELPKNTAIPSECLGCSKVVECMTMLKIEEKTVKSHVTKS